MIQSLYPLSANEKGTFVITGSVEHFKNRKEVKELIRKSVPDPKVELSESELLELLPRWENNGSVKNSRCSIDLSVVRNILEKKFLRK